MTRGPKLLAIAAMPVFAGVIHAQTVFHTLEWVEVHAGTATPVANPNGVLEPGEAALLRVAVEFDPIGTVITLPTISGTVAGLSRSIFAIMPQEISPGTWSHPSVAAGFVPSTETDLAVALRRAKRK